MRDELENIDDLFASELKGHSPSPPEGMWEKIEQRIPQQKSKKTPFMFYRVAASIALLLSTGTLGVYLITHTPDHELSTAEVIINDTPELIEESETESKTNLLEEEKPITVIASNSTPIILKSTNNVESKDIPVQIVIDPENNKKSSEPKEAASIQSGNSISSIEPEINSQTNKEQTIIYKAQKAEDSEAYKAFLAEFESLDEETSSRQKWAVGGQAGPQYTYRQVSSSADNVSQEFIDKYNQEEAGIIAYAGGINIAYKPARRLSIQSGIYYSKMGQTAPAQPQQIYSYEFVGAPNPNGSDAEIISTELRVASSMGDIDNPPAEKTLEEPNLSTNQYEGVSQVNQYLEFLEIPLMARYAIIDRKVNFHLLGGLSTNFLIASPVYLDNGDYYSDTKGLNKINYSSTLGLGLGYNFSSNFSFSIEPQFKYYLNKVNSSSSTDVHPYSFGVFTGVTYLF